MTPEDRFKDLSSRGEQTPSEAEWLGFRDRAHRSVRARRLGMAAGALGVVAAIAVGVTALGGTFDRGSTDLAGPSGPESTPTATDPKDLVALQQWFVVGDELQPFHVLVPRSATPATSAVDELLDGPESDLAERGAETMVPEGTTLSSIEIDKGTAEVTLAGDYPDDSSTQQELALGQLVFTLTQFQTVGDVVLAWESPETGGASTGPLTRKNYEGFLSQIVVEDPYFGQNVDNTFRLRGIANVYEANVSWRIVDEAGTVLQEGFTTATCGTGCWGTFDDRIRYTGETRDVTLQVFQASAEDGSPMNMVEIPLKVDVPKS